MNKKLAEDDPFDLRGFVLEVPSDVPMSQHLKENAEFFIKVKMYGIDYYIPINRALKKSMGIKILKGEVVLPDGVKHHDFLDGFRNIIDGISLQVRDTVGNEVSDHLSRELQKGLAELFEKNLSREVFHRIDKGMKVKQIEHKDSK